MVKKYTKITDLMIGAVQLNSSEDIEKNLSSVADLIEKAEILPDVLVLPEMFNYRKSSKQGINYSETKDGRTIKWLKKLTKSKNIWIIAGSISEKSNQSKKAYNTCFIINPDGEIVDFYRKIHLFDVTIENKNIFESNHYLAGKKPVIFEINGWKIGIAICYDLRFPELFQYYFNNDVDIIVIPSSFTYETGEMHWHTLCKARAIENQCYIIAPNQYGIGAGGKLTYGHSLIINPYGKILSEEKYEKDSLIQSLLKHKEIESFKKKIPIKRHKKQFI